MNIFVMLGLLLVGLVAGYFSGLIGIGGGVIIVPALVLLFGFTEHTAQGTTLALLVPPIGILAVMSYYQKGYVDIKTAIIICIGFVIGGFIGGKMAVSINETTLRKIFAVVLILLGAKIISSCQLEYGRKIYRYLFSRLHLGLAISHTTPCYKKQSYFECFHAVSFIDYKFLPDLAITKEPSAHCALPETIILSPVFSPPYFIWVYWAL